MAKSPTKQGKKTAAPSARRRRPRARARRGGASTLFFILLGVMVVFAPVMTALLLVGLLPTLILLLVDNGPFKFARLNAMFGFNAAGALPYAVALWDAGLRMQDFIAIISDILTWAIMYGAAGAGAAAIWLGPMLAAGMQQLFNNDGIRELDRERESLIAEWGEAVARDIEA